MQTPLYVLLMSHVLVTVLLIAHATKGLPMYMWGWYTTVPDPTFAALVASMKTGGSYQLWVVLSSPWDLFNFRTSLTKCNTPFHCRMQLH